MSNKYVISDLHFGHKNVHKFRTQFESEADHRSHIIERWNDTVLKGGDTVYVLGDAAFTLDGLESFGKMKGKKILVRGNHDDLSIHHYLAYFDEVYGIIKYKRAWLSHAPVHPQELRGLWNVHGHVHFKTIPDSRYINVSPEEIGYAPILLPDLIRHRISDTITTEGD